jgi:sensor domain CHASE-containing protein
MITLSEDWLGFIIPVIVVILIILLIQRLRGHIRRTVRNEIYDHFPTIKNKIEEYERKIQYFKVLVDDLERRMREMERRIKK